MSEQQSWKHRILTPRRGHAVLSWLLLAVGLGLVGSATMSACGEPEGFSGTPLARQVSDLSSNDMRALCDWVTTRHGGVGSMHECENNLNVTIETIDECVADQGVFDSCDLTVMEWEECVLDTPGDPCGILVVSSCAPLKACYF